jgi:hypothetical protein
VLISSQGREAGATFPPVMRSRQWDNSGGSWEWRPKEHSGHGLIIRNISGKRKRWMWEGAGVDSSLPLL